MHPGSSSPLPSKKLASTSRSRSPPSEYRLLPATLSARAVDHRHEVRQAAEAREHGGRHEDLVVAGVPVEIQVAERVAVRLVAHDSDDRQVEGGGGHVVRQVGAQPPLAAEQRHQVLLVQQREEEEGDGEEPEEHRNEQGEVDRALVLIGGDGHPQAGAECDLQDPHDPRETPEELEDVLPHLRLGRFAWHLSLSLSSSAGRDRSVPSFPGQGGRFLPAADRWWDALSRKERGGDGISPGWICCAPL